MATPTLSHPKLDNWILGKLSEWGISSFTDIQEKALAEGIAEGRSQIVVAPTSSGKTLVAEIAILSMLRAGLRVVYLVSHRALADQKYSDFEARFGESSKEPIAHVALSTGDRSEGNRRSSARRDL